MYNIYITKFNQILDLGTDEHLSDAIARAQRTATDWKLQNGEIIEIVGTAPDGTFGVHWKRRMHDVSDRWGTVTMNEY